MGQTLSPEKEEKLFEGWAEMFIKMLQLDEFKIDR